MTLGLSRDELQRLIETRLASLDEAQEEEEHLGPYADLLRLATGIAFHRAAELIVANNKRLEQQLQEHGLLKEI
jgi:hypothetical protein